MNKSKVFARLRVSPSYSIGPSWTVYELRRRSSKGEISITTVSDEGRSRQVIPVDPTVFDLHWQALSKASIPLILSVPEACDGAGYQLTLFGQGASVTLNWDILFPEGHDALRAVEQFVTWLVAHDGHAASNPNLKEQVE